MNDLIRFDTENQTISARELYDALEIKYSFARWSETNLKNFTENVDFFGGNMNVRGNQYGGEQSILDYRLTIETAKHICLMSNTEKGKQCRQYLINIEKAWNTPELVFARALKMADKTIHSLSENIRSLESKIESDKPKVLFADAVATSNTSILIGDLAKLLRQNGIETGQKRLFAQLREDGFLLRYGNNYNMPSQRSMEMGLFEIKEHTISNPDGSIRITKTVKVTGKGQTYFINKYLGNKNSLQEVI